MFKTMTQTATIDRRAALGSLAAAAGALLAVPKIAKAAEADKSDAEIIALSAEIIRRCAEADLIEKTRIDPFEEQFQAIGCNPSKSPQVGWEEACAFSRACGREAAIEEVNEFYEETDRMFKRLMATPATSQPGRAGKVRALILHVMRDDWRGPTRELDWDKDMARALLGEFAGMSTTELEQI